MDEIWLRLALIGGVVALAATVILVRQGRGSNPVRVIDAPGFAEGTYFFSSVACTTCSEARAKLESALGSEGYTEIAWEREPGPFEALGIDAVPAVMVVDDRRRGRLHVGRPDPSIFH